MPFPKFLKIGTILKTRLLKANKTIVTKEFQECAEDLLIRIFSEKLGFSYQIVIAEDGEYGRQKADGNWTGMVGLLHRKEVDLIFHRFAIAEERMGTLDYSYPYHLDGLVFATRNLERSVFKDSFLKPFSFNVWMGFITCVCVMPILLNVLYEKKLSFRRLFACTLFEEPSSAVERRFSESIFRTTWEISMMLFSWCYVALILSFLTFPTLTGVRTIPELATAVRERRYQCTAAPGVYLTKALVRSGGYSTIIGRSLEENEGTLDFEGALEKKGLAKKQAVIASDIDLMYLKEKYYISEDGFFPVLLGIGISKNFCCKRDLDFIVHYLWSSGIYPYLLRRGLLIEDYKILQQSPLVPEDENNERPLSLEDFIGVFILLASGHALALITFLLELLHAKYGKP